MGNRQDAGRWDQCLRLLALVVAGLPLALTAHGHSLEARRDAALGGGFGLELRLEEPGRDGDAYLGLGAADGLSAETALEISLSLDPSGLKLTAPEGRYGALPFLRLAPAESAPARVVVALARAADGPWLVTAWSWDESRARHVVTGQAPLLAGSEAQARLTLRWTARPAGGASLQVLRRQDRDRLALLFEQELPAGADAPVGSLKLGSLADDARGVGGRLRLDDFSVSRLDPQP